MATLHTRRSNHTRQSQIDVFLTFYHVKTAITALYIGNNVLIIQTFRENSVVIFKYVSGIIPSVGATCTRGVLCTHNDVQLEINYSFCSCIVLRSVFGCQSA